MRFDPTDDQRMLGDTVGRLVRDRLAFEDRLKAMKSAAGFDEAVWREFAALGLLGVGLPEAAGGFGGGGFEIMTVTQALGRSLLLEPWLASVVLGGGALVEAGSPEQQARWLAPMIAGEARLAFAHGEPASGYTLSHVETRARREGEGWRLDGAKAVVLHAAAAQALVVSARVSGGPADEDGLALFVVPADAAGLRLRAYPTHDGLRAAEIALESVRLGADAALGEPGRACPAIERTVARGLVALCAEAVGAMEVACEQTQDYLKQRRQFGRTLGSFQALQHRMVDLRTELEQARSMAILAAGRLDAERALRESALSAAKALIGRVGRRIAEEAIQLHGGVGMTWEVAVAHYAKRLVMIDHRLGDEDHHLERFVRLDAEGADALGLAGAA